MKRRDIFFIVLILCIIVLCIMHWGFLGIILLAIVFGLWDSDSISNSANKSK